MEACASCNLCDVTLMRVSSVTVLSRVDLKFKRRGVDKVCGGVVLDPLGWVLVSVSCISMSVMWSLRICINEVIVSVETGWLLLELIGVVLFSGLFGEVLVWGVEVMVLVGVCCVSLGMG